MCTKNEFQNIKGNCVLKTTAPVYIGAALLLKIDFFSCHHSSVKIKIKTHTPTNPHNFTGPLVVLRSRDSEV